MSQIIYYPFEESEDSQRIFTSLNNKYGRPINHSMFISPRREDIYRFVVPDISPNWCKEYKFVWGFWFMTISESRSFFNSRDTVAIVFKNKDDALMFRLQTPQTIILDP